MRLIQRQNKVRGFTLTEILVVMVIAGILLALTLGLYGRVKSKQVESRLKTEMAAIELALENYKAEKGVYPSSVSWDVPYPRQGWGGPVAMDNNESLPDFPFGRPWANRLYMHLCPSQGRQFLSEGRNSTDDNNKTDPDNPDNPRILLSSAPDVVQGKLAKWHYNSLNPKYNKNSYDLWVEYGDYGEDGNPGGGDDVIKVISNWSN
tara:strand:+ start:707 stop:1324 length:618 start_codon:yes stop_codon:yes gene_type:complete